MKRLLLISLVFIASAVAATPIECLKEGTNSIIVKMVVPHPKDALIYRPSGETVWLQVEGELAHKKIPKFENLREWNINSGTMGTIFENGKATAQPVITSNGVYHLYIADNTETEKENTYFIECYFEITE